jgi:hypothetical protein
MFRVLLVSFFTLISMSSMAKVSKETKVFLKCLRQLGSSVQINRAAMLNAIKWVDQYEDEHDNVAAKACLVELEKVKLLPKRSRFDIREEYSDILDASHNLSYWYFKDFVDPNFECNVFGVRAEVGAFVGVSTSISAGRCIRSNGFSWLVVAPSLGVLGGYGISLSAVKQELSYIFDEDMGTTQAIGMGEYESNNGDDGVAIGFSLNFGVDVTIPIGLMPLGVNYKLLYKKLVELRH